jgi:hypothetical protein
MLLPNPPKLNGFATTPTQTLHKKTMKTQLEQLKAELREFIELSKTVPTAPWKYDDDMDSDGGWIYAPDRPLLSKGDTSHSTMFFIARSRNLSPAMAECLLIQIEWLELFATPVYYSNNQLKKLLTIWEASK